MIVVTVIVINDNSDSNSNNDNTNSNNDNDNSNDNDHNDNDDNHNSNTAPKSQRSEGGASYGWKPSSSSHFSIRFPPRSKDFLGPPYLGAPSV